MSGWPGFLVTRCIEGGFDWVHACQLLLQRQVEAEIRRQPYYPASSASSASSSQLLTATHSNPHEGIFEQSSQRTFFASLSLKHGFLFCRYHASLSVPYPTLDQAGEGDTRLIRLWPGTFDEEEIRLGIFHVPRSSKPVYEALSYAWGCPDHTDHVLICESDRRQERGLQRDLADLEIQETVESAYTLGISLTSCLLHCDVSNTQIGQKYFGSTLCASIKRMMFKSVEKSS
ncbi:uncharacterized protein RSE6_11413 [Rhynchosporium secalis]|uniref:Heterokaryon incompatibility domain-containing protein n=1 Tax=Rhynchosporium secalis TaxID=38038 RepID=A0A1E1MMW8_RHYSE|nr:uncharacterized protein RSE6_11413 [Rhynchosporium secalis]